MTLTELFLQQDTSSMAPLTEAELFRLACTYPGLAPGGGISPMPAFCQPAVRADVDIQLVAAREQALISGLVQAAVARKRLLKR